jgi:hypothetical protein
MSGRAATRRRARTRLLAVPVAAVVGLSIAGTGLQPAGASPVAAAGKVTSGRARSPVAAQAGLSNVGDDIQKMLLKFAAQKLLGFAFNKLGLNALLGDTEGAKLDELKAQIAQISVQVKVLQDSLNQISTDLAKLALEGFTVPLGATVSKIKSLYLDFYVPTLDALTSYVTQDLQVSSTGSTCSAVDACVAARDHYDLLRTGFLAQFTAEGAASYNIQIHDALVPGAINDSVMSAYGLYLAKSGTGLLNSTASDAIQNFYNYWANYEALSAWMKAQ